MGCAMFKTIVVAVDGSPDGDRALEFAMATAAEQASRLVAVHVTEFVGGKGGVYPLAVDEDDVKVRIEAQVEKLRTEGLEAELVSHSVRLGGPAHVIAEVADSVDADVIIVGGRGRSPISDVLVGSVPTRLLQIAHRPVLVVPPPAKPS